jgi:hypothetical protein
MTVRGKSLYHCHGRDKGKKIRTYKTRAKAQAAHRAIMAKRKGK